MAVSGQSYEQESSDKEFSDDASVEIFAESIITTRHGAKAHLPPRKKKVS